MPSGRISGGLANARATYEAEIARGRSYIVSTLTPDSRNRAINEILLEFCSVYGDRELGLFQNLLSEDLQRRGEYDAASAVLGFKLPSP
jgi:hypothetical protein